MSESSLPDDPNQWPLDPYELLGLPRGAGPRDLRRAYTQLIRIYKPEQFPEQFRRIRAAYEGALRLVEFLSGLPSPGFAGEGPGVRADLAAPSPPAPLPQSRERGEVLDPADDANALWELAASGHEARAYAGLMDLFRRRPEQSDLPLRLYWLLALNPDLDPDCDPCSWLAAALPVSQLSGPATELYRRELEERPVGALGVGDLVSTIDAPPDRIAAFLASHAAAAIRVGSWGVVTADLDCGRQRVRPTDDNSWLRFLLDVIDHVAWLAGGPNGSTSAIDEIFADCREEVAALGHLAVNHAAAFDRLEYLLAAAKQWAWMRHWATLPSNLLDLLPAAWVKPFAEIRPQVTEFLAEIARAPHIWLRHLDQLAVHSPTGLGYLGDLLNQFQDRLAEPPAVPHAPADLARLVAECLQDNNQWDYRRLRSQLLALCLQEAVGAELVAAVAPHKNLGGVLLPHAMAGDWPLRYVTLACRLAWA